MSRRRHIARLGFTLLEVMVAVAILAIAMTAIFSSEGGAIKAAHRARKMGIATQLARCKMAEIEEQVVEEGLPAIDEHERDECCEGAEIEGFSCEWSIDRIVLPEDLGAEGEDGEDGAFGSLGDDGDEGAVGSMLAAGADGDAMAELAMTFAFPVLKPALEEQVRRATVRVVWREGTREIDMELTQFLVSENVPDELTQDEENDAP